MRIQIVTRHCDVPSRVRERAESRVRKLVRYEPRLSAAELIFQEEKHNRKVEGILSVDGEEPVVARGQGTEFKAAVDQVADRLARMLRRRRDQHLDHQGPRHAGTEEVVENARAAEHREAPEAERATAD